MLSLLAVTAPPTVGRVLLFPIQEYWWFYAGFTAFVLVLLSIDLGVFHRSAHSVSFREASLWCVVWVGLALLFNLGFYEFMLHRFPADPRLAGIDVAATAKQTALEFLAGYVVEYSLSVDNIFVFVVVLTYFQVPAAMQHRVLFFGILGALVFRGIFIAIGAALMRYVIVVWLFGIFLVITGFRLMFGEEKEPDPEGNAAIRTFRKFVPVTPDFEGQSFFVKQAGRTLATPLFISLMFLEMTDIVFAVDSVPAIFALTKEPLVVFTSNIFAILGLRNLYFLLANAMDKFHMLKYGLGVVLIFVGLKMTILHEYVTIQMSLAVIMGVIAVSIILSLLFPVSEKPDSEVKS
jgi:tellurite resistance protein TerC